LKDDLGVSSVPGNDGDQAALPGDSFALVFRVVVDFVADQLMLEHTGTWFQLTVLQEWLRTMNVGCQEMQVLDEACSLAQELGLLEREGCCLRVPTPRVSEFSWDYLLELEEHQASVAEGSEEGTKCEES
jgi:hypothetical protein